MEQDRNCLREETLSSESSLGASMMINPQDDFIVKNSFGLKINKKAKIRNQHHQIPTPDSGHHMGKLQNTRKRHKQESQEVSPFPAGDHKVTRNRQDSMTDKHETQITKRIHKRSTTLEENY